MYRSQLTNRHEMDDLALGLALRGWVVRLETGPCGRLAAPATSSHTVVPPPGSTWCGPPGAAARSGCAAGGALSLLGVAVDIDEVHTLIRHDIAAQHPEPPSTQPHCIHPQWGGRFTRNRQTR